MDHMLQHFELRACLLTMCGRYEYQQHRVMSLTTYTHNEILSLKQGYQRRIEKYSALTDRNAI